MSKLWAVWTGCLIGTVLLSGCQKEATGQVAAVVNFQPRQIGKFKSEVLTLGFPDENGEVVLFSPDHPVPDGARLF